MFEDVNSNLRNLYNDWKVNTSFTDELAKSFSPPLLLQATEGYLSSKTRIMIFGQETTGWKWTKDLRIEYPKYPKDWPYKDIRSMKDFSLNDDSVAGLCWGYQEFAFGRWQPTLSKTPFWQAFSEIASWPDVGVMWNNLVKADYSTSGTSWSILQAPPQIQEAFITQQANLIHGEIEALQPHVCIFLTGPNYDRILRSAFPQCVFTANNGYSERAHAKIADKALSQQSFRTYHPKFLRMNKLWDYIDYIRRELRL